jgi:hypothetical protein
VKLVLSIFQQVLINPKDKELDIKNMTKDIVESKNRFYNLLMLDKITQKLVKKYGEF